MLKKLLLFALIGILTIQSNAQNEPSTSIHLYPFNQKVLNLKTLQYNKQEKELDYSFKTNSKYAVRYRGLAIDRIAYKGMLFEALEDNSLLFKNLETKAVTPLPNKEKGIPIQAHSLMLEANGGIICIKSLKANNGYMIYKYNEKGEELFGVQLTHSEFVQHGEFTYHLPYLGYTTHTSNTVVFSSYVNRIPKTVTFSTLDGSMAKFDFSSIGIIRDGDLDTDVHGFIQLDREKSSIKVTYISDNFSIEQPYFSDITHAETLILENTLVLAVYNGHQPDARLLGIDLSSKQLKWEANVATFGGKANSTYFNAIWLGEYDGKILLEGYESQGKYLQVFDKETGKRLWKSF